MSGTTSFDLQRFVDAQDPVFDSVLSELRRGRKQGHWMWFVFPQIKGLGFSSMANTFGIASREEAEAYLAHPVLGPRLIQCTELVNAVEGRSITNILGSPDDMKFRSSMTLFNLVGHDQPIFKKALDKYFQGLPDERTVAGLGLTAG